jgi:quinol monooxygenase YgiN
MRRKLTMAVLLVGVAVAGLLAYQAQAQQRQPRDSWAGWATSRWPEGSERILIAEAIPQAPAAAPAPVQPPGPVYVVTFVDITPNNRDAGTDFCKQYVADTRKDPGVTSAQLLAQTNRPNHLVIYEVFQNQAAFERHEALAHTKDFRSKMAPIIGSPFDQRPHYVVP